MTAKAASPSHGAWTPWQRPCWLLCRLPLAFANFEFQVVAIAVATVYQMGATWHLPALSDSTRPVMLLGLLFFAFAHYAMRPQLASRVGCCTLLLIAAHRCYMATIAPVNALHEELSYFQGPGMLGSILQCACLGTALGAHSHLPRQDRWATFLLFNATYLARSSVLYHRTGTRQFVQHVLLLVCAPFCAAFLLTRWPAVRGLVGHMRLDALRRLGHTHGVTPLHVGSDCAHCPHYLATLVLKPCGLGLCPECFEEVERKAKRKGGKGPSVIVCPQCHEHSTHWVSIRHCDLEDEKAV
mmetsp:Transcript_20463/g.52078  ORF Transcript_20463/g.52078 Transcript_20463/m.52078 type:complete len:298 (-) Transcript_20463:1107-2000(-)